MLLTACSSELRSEAYHQMATQRFLRNIECNLSFTNSFSWLCFMAQEIRILH